MIRFIAVSAFLALVCVMQSAGSAAAEQKLGALDVAKDDLPIDRNRSHMVAITDKAGVLRFLGHRHAIMATEWSTRGVYDPSRLQDAAIVLRIPVPSLRIDSERARALAGLGSGPGTDTVKQLQDKMLGPQVLDAERYPTIVFRSRSVEATGDDSLVIHGELTLHGRAQRLDVPVRRQRLEAGAVRLSADFTIRQSDYGIEPESIAGVVNMADAIRVRVVIVTTARPAGPTR